MARRAPVAREIRAHRVTGRIATAAVGRGLPPAVNPGVTASLADGTALVSVCGRRSGPGGGLDAGLGLHAPGGDRVGQCGVVAFGLVGVGLGEVGHGLVELV
jgi:hypothetical protein